MASTISASSSAARITFAPWGPSSTSRGTSAAARCGARLAAGAPNVRPPAALALLAGRRASLPKMSRRRTPSAHNAPPRRSTDSDMNAAGTRNHGTNGDVNNVDPGENGGTRAHTRDVHAERANAVLDRHFLTSASKPGRHEHAAGHAPGAAPESARAAARRWSLLYSRHCSPNVTPRVRHPGWYRRLRTVGGWGLQPGRNRRSPGGAAGGAYLPGGATSRTARMQWLAGSTGRR